jgi:hypothetical protein
MSPADDETAHERVSTTEQQRRGLLGGLLVPPLVWLAQLQANYALVSWVCSTGHRFVLVSISLLAILVSAAAGYAAWTSWPGNGRLTGEPRGVEGARLLSIVGVVVSAGVVVVLVAMMIPTFVLGPCD